jgi:hypothetical protein
MGAFVLETLTFTVREKVTVILGIAVIAAVFATILLVRRNRGQKQRKMSGVGGPSTSWKSYLKLQGLVLCGFLLLGAFIGWVSAYWGPIEGRIVTGGKLVEFRNLDLSQHSVYEDLDVENYSGITIVTKATSPEKGVATLFIYADNGRRAEMPIRELESIADSWSRWDQEHPGKHISLTLRGSQRSGVIPATQADILVYLWSK